MSVSTEEISGSLSTTALTWWNAATTIESGSSAAASWAAEPSGT